MKVVTTVAELREALKLAPDVGFVPTMGALHEGHASLLHQARAECSNVVLSIFVNPTQFGPNEDLNKYPRNLDGDLRLAESEGVDIVFTPSVEEMYGSKDVVVHVDGPSRLWEGEFRPGHFDGVATIVAKLFLAVGTCRAYFGLKDLQQCAVIRAMVDGLFLPVNLRFCPTVRESNGLAKSSRNQYLSQPDREEAALIYRAITDAAAQLQTKTDRSEIDTCLLDTKGLLRSKGFDVDYLELVDPVSMEPSRQAEPQNRIIVAARFKGVRLIDNIAISEQH